MPIDLAVLVSYAQGLPHGIGGDWFGNNDPYVVVQCGRTTKKTRTAPQGGSNPVWNDLLRFTLEGERELQVTVKDQCMLKDVTLCTGSIPLTAALERGVDQQSITIRAKDGEMAVLHISLATGNNPMPGLTPSGAAPIIYAAPPTFPPAAPPPRVYDMATGYAPPAQAPSAPPAYYPLPGAPPSGYPPPYAGPQGYSAPAPGYSSAPPSAEGFPAPPTGWLGPTPYGQPAQPQGMAYGAPAPGVPYPGPQGGYAGVPGGYPGPQGQYPPGGYAGPPGGYPGPSPIPQPVKGAGGQVGGPGQAPGPYQPPQYVAAPRGPAPSAGPSEAGPSSSQGNPYIPMPEKGGQS